MTTNWSIVLNLVLLAGVVLILVRILKKRKEAPILPMDKQAPSLNLETRSDDIIAIRKIDLQNLDQEEAAPPSQNKSVAAEENTWQNTPPSAELRTLMLFLLAKPHRQLAGYEMLQSILAAHLRFGEGQLFHRHQFPNGQGPVICSLAAATASGTFDLQNIGAFNAKGLCLYMHLSGSAVVDGERLEKMFETAFQLAEGLDTYLLDDQRKPFTSESKARYFRQLESSALTEA